MKIENLSEDSQTGKSRFFEAIHALVEKKCLRGRKTFTNLYGINIGDFWHSEKHIKSNVLNLAWLTYLVRDFGVSADWLLTGRGKMFKKEPTMHIGFTNKTKNNSEK